MKNYLWKLLIAFLTVIVFQTAAVSPKLAFASSSIPIILDNRIERCGQQDLKVDALDGTQVPVAQNTTSPLIPVASPDITWHCNGSNDVTHCPSGTNAVRAERGDGRLILFHCYSIDPEIRAALKFGYYRAAVIGIRSLLVILMDLPDPATPFPQTAAHYDRLIFGPGFPNINDYFTANSYGKFGWSRVPVVGPYQANSSDSEFQRFAGAVNYAGENGVNFDKFDRNQDGLVDNRELGILIVTDQGKHEGGNRPTDPSCLKPPGSTVRVCLNVAAVDTDDFDTIAHELAHSIGTHWGIGHVIDLYGANCSNFHLTLMSCTGRTQDVYGLDPWHKIQLGWVLPRLKPTNDLGNGTYLAAASNYDGYPSAGPVIVWNPERSSSEYFIFEYRSPKQRNSTSQYEQYDKHVRDEGVVVWLIKTMPDGGLVGDPFLGNVNLVLGAPDGFVLTQLSDRRLWKPEDGDFSPTWADTKDSNVHVRVGQLPGDLSGVNISWMLGCSPLPNEIVIYAGYDFSGRCRIKRAGEYHNPAAMHFPNDPIFSVKVADGLKATLCQSDDFGSNCATFTSDDPNVLDNLVGNAPVSSMRVHCDPAPTEIAFYVDNLSGQCVYRAVGEYLNPAAIGLPNDSISSLKVGNGVKATLCRDDSFGGDCETFTTDDADLVGNLIGNDQVSSLRIHCDDPDPDQVALYVDNFSGKCILRRPGDYSNPAAIGLPNDSISSVKIGSKVQVVLCQHDNFEGVCENFAREDPDLSDNPIGTDQISSLKVQATTSLNDDDEPLFKQQVFMPLVVK